MSQQCFKFFAQLTLFLLANACNNTSDLTAPYFAYDPAIVPVVDFDRLPFPNDLYRDTNGRLHLAAHPHMGVFVRERFLPALEHLNGFGTQQGVYFGLTATQEQRRSISLASLAPQHLTAAAVIVSTGVAQVVMKTEVHFDQRLLLLSVTPFLGHPLTAGGTFVALVNRQAASALLGMTLDVAPAFRRAVIEGNPANAAETRVSKEFRDRIVLAAAAANIPLDDLAAATVFSVQTPTADLDAIAAQIEVAEPALPVFRPTFYGSGLTGAMPLSTLFGTPTNTIPAHHNPGGIVHDHVDQAFTGTMMFTMWSDTFGRKPFNRDANGKPTPFGSQEVEFILLLPDCEQPSDGYPIVIAQHGLGGNKEFALGVAEMLTSRCLAVIGIDAVAHGYRSRLPRDEEGNETGADSPDGLDDGFAYAGADQIFLVNPLVARTNLIETAAGLLQLGRAVVLGNWNLPAGALRPNFKLDSNKLGYVGQSMGGIVGSIFTGTSVDLKAAVINVGGGNFIRIASEAPLFEKLTPAFVLGLETVAPFVPDRFYPAYALFQAVMEGADPINYAPRFSKAPRPAAPRKHVLLQAASLDQLIPSSATAGLAMAAGYPLLGLVRPRGPLYQNDTPIALPTHTTVTFAGQAIAAGLVVYDPADHGFINSYCTEIEWNYEPPYERLENPYPLANPIVSAQNQAGEFLASALAGSPTILNFDGGVIGKPEVCQ